MGGRVRSLHSIAKRWVATSPRWSSAYNSDGKTTVTVLNQEPNLGIMINTYSPSGFRLNNGMFVMGPMVVFPRTVFSWSVSGDHDINEKSLGLFSLIEPKIDLIIVGYGGTGVEKLVLDKAILQLRHKRGLNVEILPTEKATATFNFLNGENRFVAAALIPPVNVRVTDDDIVLAKQRKNELYSIED